MHFNIIKSSIENHAEMFRLETRLNGVILDMQSIEGPLLGQLKFCQSKNVYLITPKIGRTSVQYQRQLRSARPNQQPVEEVCLTQLPAYLTSLVRMPSRTRPVKCSLSGIQRRETTSKVFMNNWTFSIGEISSSAYTNFSSINSPAYMYVGNRQISWSNCFWIRLLVLCRLQKWVLQNLPIIPRSPQKIYPLVNLTRTYGVIWPAWF